MNGFNRLLTVFVGTILFLTSIPPSHAQSPGGIQEGRTKRSSGERQRKKAEDQKRMEDQKKAEEAARKSKEAADREARRKAQPKKKKGGTKTPTPPAPKDPKKDTATPTGRGSLPPVKQKDAAKTAQDRSGALSQSPNLPKVNDLDSSGESTFLFKLTPGQPSAESSVEYENHPEMKEIEQRLITGKIILGIQQEFPGIAKLTAPIPAENGYIYIPKPPEQFPSSSPPASSIAGMPDEESHATQSQNNNPTTARIVVKGVANADQGGIRNSVELDGFIMSLPVVKDAEGHQFYTPSPPYPNLHTFSGKIRYFLGLDPASDLNAAEVQMTTKDGTIEIWLEGEVLTEGNVGNGGGPGVAPAGGSNVPPQAKTYLGKTIIAPKPAPAPAPKAADDLKPADKPVEPPVGQPPTDQKSQAQADSSPLAAIEKKKGGCAAESYEGLWALLGGMALLARRRAFVARRKSF